MTYTPVRYRSYQEYLDDEQLNPEGNYRLLSTGEVIEVASEDDINLRIAIQLAFVLFIQVPSLKNLIRTNAKEMEVNPVGDRCVNRKPDLVVVRPEHLESARQSIRLGQLPPQFIVEVVSPGSESSENYQRDYVWKRSQYQQLGIPEYWIVDPHLQKVTVLILVDGAYQETIYRGDRPIQSKAFPTLSITASEVLAG